MKILQTIIGFVTNSSSANYWLNDEVLEEWEDASTTIETALDAKIQKTSTSSQVNVNQTNEVNLKQAIKEPVVDFSIWFVFSLILVLITIRRKIKK